MKAALILIIALILSQSPVPLARAGTEGGGAGDTESISEKEWYELIEHLNIQVRIYSKFLDPARMGPEAREVFADIVKKGLVDDIKGTRYVPKHQCLGKNGKPLNKVDKNGRPLNLHRSAFTKRARGADICFDIKKISADKPILARLIGTIFHEHAHHFGYKDLPPQEFMKDPLIFLASDVATQVEQFQKAVVETETHVLNPRLTYLVPDRLPDNSYGVLVCVKPQKVTIDAIALKDGQYDFSYEIAGSSLASSLPLDVDLKEEPQAHKDGVFSNLFFLRFSGTSKTVLKITDQRNRALAEFKQSSLKVPDNGVFPMLYVSTDCSRLPTGNQ